MTNSRDFLAAAVASASNREPADIVIKNARIVDVFSREVTGGDVAIMDGVFVGIGEYEGRTTVDAAGRFLCPGFIDGHVHIESSTLPPSEFAKAVLPHGVTTVIADPHEIANVSGADGIRFMLDDSENIPLDVLVMLPSCVPATPFEHAGARLEAEDLAPLFAYDRVIGLGEVMNAPAVLNGETAMIAKLRLAASRGKLIDGHAAGLPPEAINVYMAAGIRTDHECTTAEEALERVRRGMYVMIREGSAAKNLDDLLPAVNERNARRFLFVTDDKHLDELLEEGSIDHHVRRAIQKGLDPLLAIQMATLNAAECFRLHRKGAIAPGYEADFLLLDDLETVRISEVYKGGRQVVVNGRVIAETAAKRTVPAAILSSMNVKLPLDDDLQIVLDPPRANVIGLVPNNIITRHLAEEVDTDARHRFQPSVAKDQLKLAVVERHRATGAIGLGIVKGLGFTSGAIASTVAHDSHNIVAAGTNDADLRAAIETVDRIGGGMAVVKNGKVLASVPLPISGLMSDQGFEAVNNQLIGIRDALRALGCRPSFQPFLTMSFLALPVIPELKLTDSGLFHGSRFTFIPVQA